MPNRSIAEFVLALLAGRERAAAIYGDLTEMAAARDGVWFVAAYARTLVSLGWRIPVALFVAEVGREMVFNLFHLYMRRTPAEWRGADGPLLNHAGPLLASMISTLWFALPFAAVRYGVRDRFVQLTFAIAVGVMLAFLFIPWISVLAAAATLVLAVAALSSARWRKPLEVLLWTGACGLLMLLAVTEGRRVVALRLAGHPLLTGDSLIVIFQASLLGVALVCSRMHRLLLSPAAGQGGGSA